MAVVLFVFLMASSVLLAGFQTRLQPQAMAVFASAERLDIPMIWASVGIEAVYGAVLILIGLWFGLQAKKQKQSVLFLTSITLLLGEGLRRAKAQLLEARELARQRLRENLHDGVLGALSDMKMKLGVLQMRGSSGLPSGIMRERASLVGGLLEVGPGARIAGRGTRVRARLPFQGLGDG